MFTLLPPSVVHGSDSERRLSAAVGELQSALADVLEKLRPYDGKMLVDRYGRILKVLSEMRGQEGEITLPFAVVDVSESEDAPKAQISPFSTLLKSLSSGETLEIIGLAAKFTPAAGNVAYLEIDVSDGEPGSVQMQYGEPWAGHPKRYAEDEDGQTKCFVPIAYFTAIADDEEVVAGDTIGEVQVEQVCHAHLVLMEVCDGEDKALIVAMNAPGEEKK